MFEEQPINSSITERLTSSDVTEEEAFDCYRRMANPTAAAVVEHFKQLGQNLSCSKVKRWADKGHWRARMDLSTEISPVNSATVLDELMKLATEPTEKVRRGLAHHVIIRLAAEIDQLDIRDIGECARVRDLAAELVKACSSLGLEPGAQEEKVYFAEFKTKRD